MSVIVRKSDRCQPSHMLEHMWGQKAEERWPCLKCEIKFLDGYHKVATEQATAAEVDALAKETAGLLTKLVDEAQQDAEEAKKIIAGGNPVNRWGNEWHPNEGSVQWIEEQQIPMRKVLKDLNAANFADNPQSARKLAIDEFAAMSHEEQWWLEAACGCDVEEPLRRGFTTVFTQAVFDCLAAEGAKVETKAVPWFDRYSVLIKEERGEK